MNIKNFKAITLSESDLIKKPQYIKKDELPNRVDDVISILETNKLIIVIDDSNTNIGILVWKDITKILSNRDWDDFITKWEDIEFVKPEDTIETCLNKMRKTGYRSFPVISENKVVGTVASEDIRNGLMQKVNITL